MTKLTSILMACLLLATTAVKAGHYLDDSNANYIGTVTLSYNIPTIVAFNATYSIYDVQINGRPAGKRLRVYNLDSTLDINSVSNNALQIDKARSNSVGWWVANDVSAANMNPGVGSKSGNDVSFWVPQYQPNCSWWTDIITAFKLPGVINSTNANMVVFFDGIGNPIAASNPTGFLFPYPSTTPTHFFGHRVDLTKTWTWGAMTISEISTATGYSWYSLYKF